MKIKETILVLGILTCILKTQAQSNTEGVSIASNVTPPNPSAMLDVQSSNKGILIPRVALISTTDVGTVPNPVKSLMVFNTNVLMTGGGEGYYYWDGIKWISLGMNATAPVNEEWKVVGTIGTMDNGEPIPSFIDGTSAPASYDISDEINNVQPLSIRMRHDGVVEIKGMYQCRGDYLGGTANFIFDLPLGYRVAVGTTIIGALYGTGSPNSIAYVSGSKCGYTACTIGVVDIYFTPK